MPPERPGTGKSLLPWHAAGLVAVFGIKLFYSRAGAGDLDWILSPVCRLAELLSGIPFEREGGIGWITRSHRMIVGPACAGLNFLVIVFSALYFPFVGRFKRAAARSGWLGASLGFAFILTLATNSLRLVAAIRLREMDLYGPFVTPERIHRLAGTAIYCLTLILAYLGAHRLLERLLPGSAARRVPSALVPLGWYLAFTLGVPLLNRAYRRDPGGFLEHAALVVLVCSVLAFLLIPLRKPLQGCSGGDPADASPRPGC